VRRINDNIPRPGQGDSPSIEEHLRVVPSKLEIQDFEKRNAELEKKIEQLEEEKMHLGLDVDVQKFEMASRDSGRKDQADGWEMKFPEVQTRNGALEKSLSENQKEKFELKGRVAKLERSLHQYQSQNSAMELRASLSKIEEMKERIEKLESALRNCEIRTEYLETNESRQREQLHHFQNQVENRDRIMGEAMVQIREVADRLQ
ncbi:hypothetical protein Gotur_027506, partial [Gossypium turneri]